MPRADRFGELVTSRPVAVAMVFLAAVVFGYFSYNRLPVTLMPELEYPTITVRTIYEGSAPEEVENDVSRPIEEELGVVGGLQRISSISRAGVSDVVLEFSWDTPIADATQEVLEKLDLVVLPEDSERPLILHYDPSLDPIMELSLSSKDDSFAGPEGERRLRRLADLQIKRSLEPIKGVAAVRVRGGLEEEIQVRLDEEQLRRTGLPIEEVINRLAQQNVNMAGGTVKDGRTQYMIRTVGEFENLQQIANAIVAVVDEREIRVKDIGSVHMSNKDREVLTRTDGGSSVQIEIYKEADANIVALAHRVRAAVGEPLDLDTPEEGAEDGEAGSANKSEALAVRLQREEGVELALVADRSTFIEASIAEVRNTAIIGGFLAVFVLFVFLREYRTTLIIGLSIPISLLVTFAPLNLLEVSLNIMSLGGLALGVGMLVDNSIVVLESIHRCREEGDDLVSAAIRGTSEVRGAVIASTLTSIAVFFPLVFVQGIAGEAFGDLGLAVVFSLLASLVVAVFLIPMLASLRFGVDTAESRRVANWRFSSLGTWARWWTSGGLRQVWAVIGTPFFLLLIVLEAVGKALLLAILTVSLVASTLFGIVALIVWALAWIPVKITQAALAVASRAYGQIMRGALSMPLVVVLAVGATLYVSYLLVIGADSELLPEVRQGEFTFEVAMPVGTPLEKTDGVLTAVEEQVLAADDRIRSLVLTVGSDPERAQRSDEGEHTARFKVLLEPGIGREAEDVVVAKLRRLFVEVPDLDARVTRPVLFSFKTPIEVEIQGDDLQQLKVYGQRVRQELEQIPELADVELSLKPGAPEVQIAYDRARLAAYGLDLSRVAQLVKSKVQGTEATRFNFKDRRVPIVARLQERDRQSIEDVRAIVVNPGGDRPIPLSAIADVRLGEGPSEIRRVESQRVALVTANLADGSLGSASQKIESTLSRTIDWPVGMSYFLAGQNEEWERSQASLYLALGLSIFLVYVIMAAQFESLVHPLVIMFSIPLAFVGTLIALRLLDISLSIVVFLGMIMLAGIVVNNAIVLVDYINTLRSRGMEIKEAILTAGQVRLRPILMTTATTILGLLPMALGFGEGAEIRTPMAIAVIGGLISSTALTLVVVPTFYWLADRAVVALGGGRRFRAAPALPSLADDGPSSVVNT